MRKPYTLDRTVRLVINVLLVILAIWLINMLRNVLLPFCVAALVAYMFEPFVQFNRRLLHLKGRVTAIFVTLFESAFFLAAALYILVPLVESELHEASQILSNYAAEGGKIAFLPDVVHDYLRRVIDWRYLSEMLTPQDMATIAENALTAVWSIVTGSVAVVWEVFSWCIVVLYVVFIMIDYDRIRRGMRYMVPPRYRDTASMLARDVEQSMNHYFRGQALIAALVGVMFAIGFSIIGLPLAIVMGIFIGILNMVPYLQLVSIVPTALLCLVYSAGGGGNFWSIGWECVVVYCVVQAIQDLVLTPKIMGKAMGLNPAIILLSLSVWGTLLGFIGLIIALPLTTLCLSYYDRYVIRNGGAEGPTDAAAVNAALQSDD